MGKRTRLREAQLRAAEQAIAVRLRAHTPARTEPAFINTFADFAPAYRSKIESCRHLALRAPEAWRCGLRVRSPERRFLELVRFAFADYAIPHHLEQAWIADGGDEWPAVEGSKRPDFRLWSIIVGRGGSLYREAARPFMTKSETHHFVTAPAEIASTQRAFWYAFARGETDDAAAALRVARSKLARLPVTEEFWKGVARFFAQNPTTPHEMDDLIDFLNAMRVDDGEFTLSGRTLPALRRRMEDWHRIKRAVNSGIRWAGDARRNAKYETFIDGECLVWRFEQIRSSGSLVHEGERMRHCVATYEYGCLDGHISIWSLTCEYPSGKTEPRLTIELNRSGVIMQCRGFANRLPDADETEVMRRWAADQELRGIDAL
jgi:PcfJ-like protein